MHRVVPELIVENFRAGRYYGRLPAVGMFLDLTGFSTMTDTLMQQGQHGAEVLANLMHGVFNPLVENIFNYGGKIVSFAGDGIMALFPIDVDEHATALRAMASAWTIQQRLRENPVRQTVYGKFTISAKIGMTVGDVSWRILRSADQRDATYYFRGSAVDASAQAEHMARPGEIMLTEDILLLLGDAVQTTPVASFQRVSRFVGPMPNPAPSHFPPADLEVSRHFVPEEIVTQDIRGEFRQIVNLFMRFPDLPDEKLSECINVIFELREQFGGLVTRLDFGDKGCNMLMLWGAPVAYENDIGRAMNFALELKARMDFPITAGVTYYVAHAGYLGSAMCEDYTCYGWGVNLASRFMMTARDGEIWVDERIARRVKNRFDFEYQGAQYFKGFAAEQKVYSFTGRKQQELFHSGEFVGRELELPRLIDCVLPLWDGKFAGVTVIWGDAGIGKSRLVYEMKDLHFKDHTRALWALCHTDQILRHSFNPFRYWLFRYFELHSTMTEAAQKQAFDSKLDALIEATPDPELAGELDRVRTVLGALVDLDWPNSLYETLDAEGRYNLTLSALICLVKAESLRQPVVLFVEDGQFLDEDTQLFLLRLKRALTIGNVEYPVAILISSRHVGTENFLTSELVDHAIELGPLSAQALASLAEIHLGSAASPEMIQLLQARSEGNPYFAEQFLTYLEEEKLIEMSPKGWRMVRRLQESSLPADIRALLVARLDQLTRRVRDVIQTAAVLGREFEVRVLAEMLADKTMLAEEVAAAEKAEIWSVISQLRYLFTHGLLRDAAYAMQMRARRVELHAFAVEALETVYTGELEHHYGELAYHAEAAQLTDRASRYLLLAGQSAKENFQNALAVDYFTRALAFLPQEAIAARFDVVVQRAEVYRSTLDRENQLADFDQLESWAEQLDDRLRLARVLKMRAVYLHIQGHYFNAVEYGKRAEECLAGFEAPSLSVDIQSAMASSLLRLGNLDDALEKAGQGLRIARDAGLQNEAGKILTVMGLIALERKDPREAYVYLEESLRIARELGNKRLEGYALNNMAVSVGAVQGDYAQAETYYRRAHEIAREVGDRSQEGVTLANLGFVAGMQGDLPSARLYHEHALLVAREIGNVYQEAYTLINLSAISGVQQDAQQALEYARQADGLVRKIHDRSGEAWSQLYIGHACLLKEQPYEARKAYQRSLALRLELNQASLAMEPAAGLLDVAMQTNTMATEEAERIIAHLESGGSFEGTEEPLRIFETCHRYLAQQKDPRAGQVLQSAKQLLETQVSKLKDEKARQAFVENFPWRLAILRL